MSDGRRSLRGGYRLCSSGGNVLGGGGHFRCGCDRRHNEEDEIRSKPEIGEDQQSTRYNRALETIYKSYVDAERCR